MCNDTWTSFATLPLGTAVLCVNTEKRLLTFLANVVYAMHLLNKEKFFDNTCTSFATLPLGTAVLCVTKEIFLNSFVNV